MRRLRHGSDAAGSLGRGDREGHQGARQLFSRKFKTKAEKAAAKARLIADPTGAGAARADIIIEAIVERLDIKQKLFAELEGIIKPGAVLATNTSSLEIEAIAAPLKDPGRLIGIHFFNPVAQMPLVEVVRGAQSREEEVKKGATFVTAIGKFPLIAKSVPGFLVNRVLAPYMMEAMARLEKGEERRRSTKPPAPSACRWAPSSCRTTSASMFARTSAASSASRRTAPCCSVWSMRRSSARSPAKASTSGRTASPRRATRPIQPEELERLGRELVEPLIRESQRALDDGVVDSADLVDAGVIFGTGFAPFRGGPLHFKASEHNHGAATREAAE